MSMRVGSTFERNQTQKDYLRDLRVQRELEQSSTENYAKPVNDWRSLVNTNKYDDKTKVELIKMKSSQIDQKFKMKEQSFNYANAAFIDTDELNNLLVDSIEAKLTVLRKLND